MNSLLSLFPRFKGGHIIRRLQEEIQKQATNSEHDVTAITLALTAGFQVLRIQFEISQNMLDNLL